MVSVKHKYVNPLADDPAAAAALETLPSHWNDDHSVSLAVADIIAAGGVSSDSMSAAVVTDALTVRGSSTFSATAIFLTDVRIAGDLQVASTASFSALRVTNVIAFQGAFTNAGTFQQQAQATFTNTVTFSATVVFNTAINVSATASIGILAVAGSATFAGTARFLAATDVSATLSVGVALIVAGTSTLSGAVRALTSVDVSATLSVGGLVVGGTATFSATAVFLTAVAISGTLSVGTLVVSGTASFSATVAFANAIVTSLGITGTASFAGQVNFAATVSFANATVTSLGITNTASFAAQVNFGASISCSSAPYVGGFQLSTMKLGSATGATSTQFKISGGWSAFQALEVHVRGKGAATTTNLILQLYTDGGTTPFITYATVAGSATASDIIAIFDIAGIQSGFKVIKPRLHHIAGIATQAAQTQTATQTTGIVNCIGIMTGAGTTTTTMSAAEIYVYGMLM